MPRGASQEHRRGQKSHMSKYKQDLATARASSRRKRLHRDCPRRQSRRERGANKERVLGLVWGTRGRAAGARCDLQRCDVAIRLVAPSKRRILLKTFGFPPAGFARSLSSTEKLPRLPMTSIGCPKAAADFQICNPGVGNRLKNGKVPRQPVVWARPQGRTEPGHVQFRASSQDAPVCALQRVPCPCAPFVERPSSGGCRANYPQQIGAPVPFV